jgi:hypothetical protein
LSRKGENLSSCLRDKQKYFEKVVWIIWEAIGKCGDVATSFGGGMSVGGGGDIVAV